MFQAGLQTVPVPVVTAQHMPYSELRAMVPDLSGVDQVIAPLFGKGFDGYELISLLAAAQFKGRLSLTGGDVANRGMVLRELRALAGPHGIEVHLSPGRSESVALLGDPATRLAEA